MKYDVTQNILFYQDRTGQHWRLDQYSKEEERKQLKKMLEEACEIHVFEVAKTHSTKTQQENFAEVGDTVDPRKYSTISNSATHFNGLRMKAFEAFEEPQRYEKKTAPYAAASTEWDASRVTQETKKKINDMLAAVDNQINGLNQ